MSVVPWLVHRPLPTQRCLPTDRVNQRERYQAVIYHTDADPVSYCVALWLSHTIHTELSCINA